MLQNADYLTSDAMFCERVSALQARFADHPLPPLEPMIGDMRRFAAARGREARLARATDGLRAEATSWRSERGALADAIAGLVAVVDRLSELSGLLSPLITPALDDIISLTADEAHPLRRLLDEVGNALGFAAIEIRWVFDELARVNYRPVHLLCPEGIDDLRALLDAVSIGERGLLLAGFLRYTGDPELDERVERIVVRLRSAGVTASMFLPLIIVCTAHAVATQQLRRA